MPSKFRAKFGNTPVKLIAVILFAILVPSVLVTGLGVVAVFQADAFVQDRFRGPLRTKVESLHARLKVEWERRLALYADTLRDAPRRRAFLGELRRKDPWIRDLLVSSARGPELVRDPPPEDLWPSGLESDMKDLRRLELEVKDSSVVLAECRRLMAASEDNGVVLEACLAAARSSYKLGNREESEQFLRTALERFGNTQDATSVIRAVPILWRLIEIQRELNRPSRVKETARELALALERYAGVLDPDLTEFFREKLASLGDAFLAVHAPPLSRLFSSEHLAQLSPVLPRPGLSAAVGPLGRSWSETHVSLEGSGDVDFASFPSEDGVLFVHLALDRARFREEAGRICTEVGLPAPGLRFLDRRSGGGGGAGNDRGEIASLTLPAPLSNLEMKYVPVEGLLPEGFRAFDVITLAAFTWAVIVLVLTIVVGVLFTLRSVLREMRTARLKSDFVSFITHELKTPLTAIRTLAETMLAGRIEDEEENRLCIQMIGTETERLAKLVDQVLEYSRIERREKEFRFTSCDMEDVVREAVRIFEEHNRFDPREIEINSAQHISKIKVDRTAMVELLLNLLSNAAKYSSREKKIAVNLRESIDDICVEVVDRGMGIRKRDQKRIFDKFFRADDYLTREIEGTGLGLTFARYIAKVHNGDIKVLSQVASGSTFTLLLRKTQVLAE